MFSGSGQLKIVLSRAGTLGLGLLAATLIAKMLSFAISQGSGFVGGPIFPSLFIGGTAGVIVHQAIPGVPLGLAFTCLLAAIPGALVAAPFAIVLMAAFLTQVGALQTAPILITVVTAFLTMQGVKYRLSSRKQARANAAKPSLATPCRTGWSRRIAIGGGRLLDVGCGPGILTVRLAHLLEEAVGLDPDLRWSAATGLIGWAPQQCPASGHRKGMWQDIGVPSGPGGWLDRGLLPRRVSGHRNGLAGTVGGCRRRVLSSPPLSPRAAARVTWPARMGSPWAGCRGLWPGTGPRATRRSSRGRGGRRPLRARSATTSSDSQQGLGAAPPPIPSPLPSSHARRNHPRQAGEHACDRQRSNSSRIRWRSRLVAPDRRDMRIVRPNRHSVNVGSVAICRSAHPIDGLLPYRYRIRNPAEQRGRVTV
jgi:hypothetical protein